MNASKAGMWLDHNHAYLIEFTAEPMTATLIESRFNHEPKPNLRFGETRMHATEQRERSSFFKELIKTIRNHKDVILFGPGTAREELLHLVRKDHRLDDISIKTVHTDKLTQGQMQTFVRKHFSVHF